MTTPEWIQQAEGWCASVENSTTGIMSLGALVSLGNLLVFRALHRRWKALRLGKHGIAPGLVLALVFWLLLSPILVMAVAGHAGAHWIHATFPTLLAVAGMAFQFAAWVYGGCCCWPGCPGNLPSACAGCAAR